MWWFVLACLVALASASLVACSATDTSQKSWRVEKSKRHRPRASEPARKSNAGDEGEGSEERKNRKARHPGHEHPHPHPHRASDHHHHAHPHPHLPGNGHHHPL